MPFILMRVLRQFLGKAGWVLPVAVVGFVFVTSWPLMLLAEGPEAELAQPANYWWWFLITSSTVGYGDFFPTTTGGHLVGAYVIVGGIATLTTLFTRIATALDNAKGRRMQGSVSLKVTDHTVVLGYTPGRSERILDELIADSAESGHGLVLCAWDDVDQHPMPDKPVDFVRGDLADENVLRRACMDKASNILVDVRDDNEALAVLVTVNHLNPDAHVVVALRDMDRAPHLTYVRDNVACVQWVHPRMIAEELQDPGITQIYLELMTHGGGNTYSAPLSGPPRGLSFGLAQTRLGRKHNATLLAVRDDDRMLVSPPWDTEIGAGSVLYYVARQRLSPDELASTLRSTE